MRPTPSIQVIQARAKEINQERAAASATLVIGSKAYMLGRGAARANPVMSSRIVASARSSTTSLAVAGTSLDYERIAKLDDEFLLLLFS
jgi:hypothetical protein